VRRAGEAVEAIPHGAMEPLQRDGVGRLGRVPTRRADLDPFQTARGALWAPMLEDLGQTNPCGRPQDIPAGANPRWLPVPIGRLDRRCRHGGHQGCSGACLYRPLFRVQQTTPTAAFLNRGVELRHRQRCVGGDAAETVVGQAGHGRDRRTTDSPFSSESARAGRWDSPRTHDCPQLGGAADHRNCPRIGLPSPDRARTPWALHH
jgi:hypothetical protein